MKRRSVCVVFAALLLACLTAALLLAGIYALRRQETTSLRSPDQRLRAVLLDRPHLPSVDRNFEVRIEKTGGASRRIFISPDESPAGIGSDRFLWSKDSKRLLLVGKRFWVREGVQLESGESLYLLYDVLSGQVWCNSDKQGPPFGPNDLTGYDFGETLRLKPVSEKKTQSRTPPLTDGVR